MNSWRPKNAKLRPKALKSETFNIQTNTTGRLSHSCFCMTGFTVLCSCRCSCDVGNKNSHMTTWDAFSIHRCIEVVVPEYQSAVFCFCTLVILLHFRLNLNYYSYFCTSSPQKYKSCLYLLSWSSWKLVLWCQNNQKNMKQLRTARLLWSKSPEASNLSVEHENARPPASDGLHANAVSLPATVKILTLWNLKVALEYFYILMMKWLVSVQCGRCRCSSKSSSASFSLFCFHVFQLW